MKHNIFLNQNETYGLAKSFIFNFSIYEIFSYFSSVTEFPPNLHLLLLRWPTLNISIVSFSSNLNRWYTLSACHRLEPIGNAQNLSLGFI